MFFFFWKVKLLYDLVKTGRNTTDESVKPERYIYCLVCLIHTHDNIIIKHGWLLLTSCNHNWFHMQRFLKYQQKHSVSTNWLCVTYRTNVHFTFHSVCPRSFMSVISPYFPHICLDPYTLFPSSWFSNVSISSVHTSLHTAKY